jgi:hypothetical protein
VFSVSDMLLMLCMSLILKRVVPVIFARLHQIFCRSKKVAAGHYLRGGELIKAPWLCTSTLSTFIVAQIQGPMLGSPHSK